MYVSASLSATWNSSWSYRGEKVCTWLLAVVTSGIKLGERKLKIGVNNFKGHSSFQEEGASSRDPAWNIMPNHVASKFLSVSQ